MSIVFSGQSYWVPILLLLSLFIAYFMYLGWNKPRKKLLKYPVFILLLLRTFGVFLLSILLLAPFLKYTSKTKHKPEITFLLDASLSVRNQSNTSSFYSNLIADAKTNLTNFNLNFKTIKGETVNDSVSIKDIETNITKAIEGLNTNITNEKAVVLCSDGIINQGANPNYYPLTYAKPIFTLGLGDTSQLKDIKVSNAKSNDFVLLGNDFPLVFDIIANGCPNQSIQYTVKNNGLQVAKGVTQSTGLSHFFSKQIAIKANRPGMQRLTIETTQLNEEKNKANNKLDVYVNVLDNRKKIALYYQGPHPDVKAINLALKAQKNYELIITSSVSEALNADAIIAVQVPNRGTDDPASNNIILSKKPVLLVGGEQINWRAWEEQIGNLGIRTAQPNLAKFNLNTTFNGFKTEDDDVSILSELPPLTTPFATYPKNLNVMATQVVNGIKTDYPLIATTTGKRRIAVIFGEGIWRWSMREYKITKNHQATEHLIDHLLQWLLSGRNKPLFTVSANKAKYTKNEEIFIKAEVYNQVFEPIKDAKVKGSVFNDSFSKSIEFGNTGSYYTYDLGSLEPGNYKINAEALGKQASNGFTVGNISQEERVLKANWNMLRTLSKNYKGSFYDSKNYKLLFNELNSTLDKTVITKTQKELKDLIQIPYLLGLIALFLVLNGYSENTMENSKDLNIKDLQARVDDWIKQYGVKYFSELTNMTILTEEVGELARLMSRTYGDQSFKKSDEGKSIADELADIIWVTTCLANQMDINLTEAILDNFEKKTTRDKNRFQK